MNKQSFKSKLFNLLLVIIFGISIVLFVVVKDMYDMKKVFIFIDVVILMISPALFLYYFLRGGYAKKKIEKETIIEKVDFDYYRDIITEYSPALLSIIHDGQIDLKKDLIASLLYLKNKKYIDIIDDTIVLTDKDYSNLPDTLQFILKNHSNILKSNILDTVKYIQDKKNPLPFQMQWFKMIENKIISEELARPMDKNFSMLTKIFILLLVIQFFFGLSSPGTFYLMILAFPLLFFIIFLEIKATSFSNYALTQKGYELYKKLCGLKNFIVDFSILTERQIEELNVWEDYLIYCIILNRHGNLNQEAQELYKDLVLKLEDK